MEENQEAAIGELQERESASTIVISLSDQIARTYHFHQYHEVLDSDCNCECKLRKLFRDRKREREKQLSDARHQVEEWVTPGNDEEYDIDKVVSDFEKGSSKGKRVKSRKKKRKSRCEIIAVNEAKTQAERPLENKSDKDKNTIENLTDAMAATDLRECGEDTKSNGSKAKKTEKNSKKKKNKEENAENSANVETAEPNNGRIGESFNNVANTTVEPREEYGRNDNECSICLSYREKTFAFIPCGHATFCDDCSTLIFEEIKKCPTCQAHIDQKFRVFI